MSTRWEKAPATSSLYWGNRIDASHITVYAVNSMVSGEVGSIFQKRSADAVALNVPGVTGVVNDISVKYPDEAPSDEDIEVFANKVMQWNPYLDASRIKISVKGGVLAL